MPSLGAGHRVFEISSRCNLIAPASDMPTFKCDFCDQPFVCDEDAATVRHGQVMCDACSVRKQVEGAQLGDSVTLVEYIRIDPKEALFMEVLSICIFSPFLFVALYIGIDDIGKSLLLSGLLLLATLVLRALGATHNARQACGRIECHDGEIIVSHKAYGSYRWPISDCLWHVGKARECPQFSKVHLWRHVIVIKAPVRLPWFWKLHMKVPCGFTPDLRSKWEQVLESGGALRTYKVRERLINFLLLKTEKYHTYRPATID